MVPQGLPQGLLAVPEAPPLTPLPVAVPVGYPVLPTAPHLAMEPVAQSEDEVPEGGFECAVPEGEVAEDEDEIMYRLRRSQVQAEADALMKAVASQCGIAMTTQIPMQAVDDSCPIGVFHYTGEEGETFSDWIIGTKGMDGTEYTAAMQTAEKATGCDDDDLLERLFDGERHLLETLLRSGWERLASSFEQLPSTAQWTMQSIENTVMPALRDDSRCYLLLPTSAECTVHLRALPIPDPYHERDPAAGHKKYMAADTWFEDCGDGGAYVLGIDDTMLIFYVDGPGNMVYGRWQCDRRRWESMWISTFGALSVTI
uniref:Uncharacterized protein n=1 Tax=Coccolithus braarudii TaxID=221442 RepID=A0A7S0LD09_9EUKA